MTAARRGRAAGEPRGLGKNRNTVVLAVGLALLAAVDLKSVAGNVLVKADPTLAHQLDPANGSVTAAAASDLFSRNPDAGDQSQVAQLAREAIRDDPTAVIAYSLLGVQAMMRDDKSRSDRIFAYSAKLSRREIRPQIAGIEEAVTRGDIPGALAHYDIAMRVSSEAPALMLPTLVQALREPKVRRALIPILLSKPVWLSGFLDYATSADVNRVGVLALLTEGVARGVPITDRQRTAIVNGLVAEGRHDLAWNYYASFRRVHGREQSRDPLFNLSGERTVFDWQIPEHTSISTAILRDGPNNVLDFTAPPGGGGVAVRQVELLRPGKYRIEGVSEGVRQPSASQPVFVLSCERNRELGRVPVGGGTPGKTAFSGWFVVPVGCPWQELSLVLKPSDEIEGISGRIERVQLSLAVPPIAPVPRP